MSPSINTQVREDANRIDALLDAYVIASEDEHDRVQTDAIVAHLQSHGILLPNDPWMRQRIINLAMQRHGYHRLPSSRFIQISGNKYNRSWIGVRLINTTAG